MVEQRRTRQKMGYGRGTHDAAQTVRRAAAMFGFRDDLNKTHFQGPNLNKCRKSQIPYRFSLADRAAAKSRNLPAVVTGHGWFRLSPQGACQARATVGTAGMFRYSRTAVLPHMKPLVKFGVC